MPAILQWSTFPSNYENNCMLLRWIDNGMGKSKVLMINVKLGKL